jgi:hypothetical protein
MRDRIWIYAGLAVFVAVVTVPFWTSHTAARTAPKDLGKVPDLILPANEKQCVAPAATMRAEHMRLLVRWREDVVRRDDRRYVAFNGKVYEKSLTKTCLGCHSKKQFCDSCHSYAGVSKPDCWNCHSEPQSTLARSAP